MSEIANENLRKALYDAFHDAAVSPKEIAQALGVSYNYLAKAVISGENGCRFPLEWLIPFMKITGQYWALKIIANACGFLLVQNPRLKKGLRAGFQDYQRRFCETLAKMISYSRQPSASRRSEAVAALTEHQEETEFWKRIIRDERNINQLAMEF